MYDYEPERETEMYQSGLLDALDDRPSLVHTLAIMGEHELLVAYGRGRLMGQRLLDDVELEL